MSATSAAPESNFDPRYPIGRFERPAAISEADRASAVETIATLPAHLRAAVSGWTDGQLDTPYREGGWTVRQLIHHVADSHWQSATRLRLALTEDHPTIQTYQEAAWAELPDETNCPVEPSLLLLEGLHARWSYLLHHLAPEQWQRPITHPESGRMTVDVLTQLYAWHSRHHLAHITELKKAKAW